MKLATVLGLGAAALMALTAEAGAQAAYPNDSVKIIVPFGAGSVTDSLARALADCSQQTPEDRMPRCGNRIYSAPQRINATDILPMGSRR